MVSVVKRNGSKEDFNLEKIHLVLDRATEGLTRSFGLGH